MNIQELTERLKMLLQSVQLNEHSRIANQIDVHTEKDKFAHFHWVYKDSIHFKFSKTFPKNSEMLRQCIAFPNEQKKISDQELTRLIKILKRPIKYDNQKMTIYEASQLLWRRLNNNREIDYI